MTNAVTTKKHKGRAEDKPFPNSSPTDAMRGGVGRDCASRRRHPAPLPPLSSITLFPCVSGAPVRAPGTQRHLQPWEGHVFTTHVVAGKSSSGWLHLVWATRSRTLNRSFSFRSTSVTTPRAPVLGRGGRGVTNEQSR